MKRLTIILFVIILGGVLFYLNFNKNNVFNINNFDSQEKSNEVILDQEKKIGNMIFRYYIASEVNKNFDDFFSLNINKKSKTLNSLKGYVEEISESTPIVFSFLKDENLDKKSIDQWFEENSPEQEKQSVYSAISEENIKIGGISSYQVRFAAQPQLTGGYYDLITIYIPYGTDIYTIESYAVPLNQPDPSLVLNEEDIKSAQEYEKIVDAIIQSIHFVE